MRSRDEVEKLLQAAGVFLFPSLWEGLPGSGVNINKFNFKPYSNNGIIKFVFISRVMKEKGIDYYLEAAEYIKKNYENVEFHVCGFCEQNYEHVLKKYEKENIINYHGMISDVSKFLEEISCVVHPTYYPEGMSNVLLESCSSGRPIITTNRSGCKEIIEDGKNGFIIGTHSKQDLIKSIEKFITLSYDEKYRMAKYARKVAVEKFDRTIVINKYISEIKKI